MRLSPHSLGLSLALLPAIAGGVVLDWSGFTDNTWAADSNWTPAATPSNGDELVFVGTANSSTLNDLVPDTVFESIEFSNTADGESFTLSGNRIGLGSSITTTAVANPAADSIEDVVQLDVVIVNADASINTGAGHSIRVDGVISGAGELVVNNGPNASDDGLVRLANANTFTGGTRLLGGSLELLSDSALGSGTVLIEDRSNVNPKLLLGVDGLTISNAIELANQGGSKTIILDLDGATQGELSGNIVLNETGSRNNRFIVGTDDVLTLSGQISGSGRLTLRREQGGGTLILANANNYTGDTLIEEGTLRIENNQALGSGEVLIEDRGVNPVLEFAGGLTVGNDISILNRGGAKRIRLSEPGAALTTLTGAISIGERNAGQFDVQVGAEDRLILAGPITSSRDAGIDKLGGGTLVLQADGNTYGGLTRISSGVLLINGDNTAVTGGIQVGAGTVLGGTGSSGSRLDVAGTIATGDSGIGSFAAAAADFVDGSTFAFEFNSSAVPSFSADMLVLDSGIAGGASGSVSLLGVVELTIADLAGSPSAFALGTKLNLVNYDGAWNGGSFTYDGTIVGDGDRFFAGLNEWQINYADLGPGQNQQDDQIGGSYITLTAVPEFSQFGLWVAVFALCVAGPFRRRTSRLSRK